MRRALSGTLGPLTTPFGLVQQALSQLPCTSGVRLRLLFPFPILKVVQRWQILLSLG